MKGGEEREVENVPAKKTRGALKDLDTVKTSTAIQNRCQFMADKYHIHKSLISKWSKQEKELKEEADMIRTKKTRTGKESNGTARTRKIMRKFRSTYFPSAEQNVLSEFEKQKAKGLKVNGKLVSGKDEANDSKFLW